MSKKEKTKYDCFVGKGKTVDLSQGKRQIIDLVRQCPLSDDNKKLFEGMLEQLEIPEGPLVIKYNEATIPAMPVEFVMGKHGMVEQIKQQTSNDLLSAVIILVLATLGKISEPVTTLVPVRKNEYMHVAVIESKSYFFSTSLKGPRWKVVITFNSNPLPQHKTPKVLFGSIGKPESKGGGSSSNNKTSIGSRVMEHKLVSAFQS